MGNMVEIKVSRELAEWLRQVVDATSDGLDFSGGVNRAVVVSAIDDGLRYHTRRPRVCEREGCNNPLSITGYGKPRKFCSDACRQAAYRLSRSGGNRYKLGGRNGINV